MAITNLPFGHGKDHANSGALAAIAGGWKVNWILSRTSGTPFHRRNLRHLGERAWQHADGGPGEARGGDPGRAWRRQPYFDPLAFRAVTDVRFGNIGRNIMRGPGVFNLDGSVFRNFTVTEAMNFEVRMEMFGVTNTPQFSNPGRYRIEHDAQY